MTYDPATVDGVATALVYTSTVAAFGYTLGYGFGTPWRRSLLGTVMFLLGISLTGVLGIVAARRLFGAYPGYELAALIVYVVTTLATWGLLVVFIIERRRGTVSVAFHIRKESLMSNESESTASVNGVQEIWYKAQRVIRTVVQVVVSAAVTVALAVISVAAFAPDVLDALADVLPETWAAWLGGAVAFLVALAGALSRIMAIPAVNAWLAKIGLGSVPPSAIDKN